MHTDEEKPLNSSEVIFDCSLLQNFKRNHLADELETAFICY